jgi:hypothetical protein
LVGVQQREIFLTTNITRIEFLCEDKKVGDAFRNLLGIAIGSPKATPVINAEVEKITGMVKPKTNGKLINQFLYHLQEAHIEQIRPKEVGAWLKKHGYSGLSASYIVRQATGMGVLKKTGASSNTVYHVIRALPKPAKGGSAHG